MKRGEKSNKTTNEEEPTEKTKARTKNHQTNNKEPCS